MTDYVSIPTITDPDALAQDNFEYLQNKVPAWEPHDGQLDTWMLSAGARMIATLLDTMTDVESNIFRYYGASVLGLVPVEALPATVLTTWTMIDSLGHTIPLGTGVAVTLPSGETVPFETTEEIVVPNGQNKTAAGGVKIAAIEPGAEGSGVGGPSTEVLLVDQLPFVQKIEMTSATSGGRDAETDEEYLGRLISSIQLQSPRPIVPTDFAKMAATIPGIQRALAYTSAEREVTLAYLSATGQEASAGAIAEAKALLASLREVNFIISTIAITFTEISVEYEVKIWPEWTKATVEAAIKEALATFLSSATWGQPPFGDKRIWYPREKVPYRDIVAVIGGVSGVQDVLKVKTKKAAGAFEEVDITLAGGNAGLPKLGTVTGTLI